MANTLAPSGISPTQPGSTLVKRAWHPLSTSSMRRIRLPASSSESTSSRSRTGRSLTLSVMKSTSASFSASTALLCCPCDPKAPRSTPSSSNLKSSL